VLGGELWDRSSLYDNEDYGTINRMTRFRFAG
jgi:hypothetical protein